MSNTLKEARRLWGGADYSLPPGQQEELRALEAYTAAKKPRASWEEATVTAKQAALAARAACESATARVDAAYEASDEEWTAAWEEAGRAWEAVEATGATYRAALAKEKERQP